MGKAIIVTVTVESVKAREGEDGTGDYYDVKVTATVGSNAVRGTLSLEIDGQPVSGSNDEDWASADLAALESELLDEIRAQAAAQITARPSDDRRSPANPHPPTSPYLSYRGPG